MSQENVQKLQVLQNNAARLVKRVDKSKLSSASALLFALHWLPVEKRIVYKIAVLTYNCLYDKASPEYLQDLIVRYDPDRFVVPQGSVLGYFCLPCMFTPSLMFLMKIICLTIHMLMTISCIHLQK